MHVYGITVVHIQKEQTPIQELTLNVFSDLQGRQKRSNQFGNWPDHIFT